MQITGTYMNYVNMSSLLSSIGVKSSADMVMSVFSASIENLQGKVNKQIFAKESTQALKALYAEVSDLSEKASKLTLTHMGSVFYDRTPVSSDANVLTATALNALSNDLGAAEATYNITVDQLAQAQKNAGTVLDPDDISIVNAGTNRFRININGQDHGLNFEAAADDTNGDVLEKIMAAINEADLGLTAKIEETVSGDTWQLVIEADKPGVEAGFTITDISGNAVTATGIDTVTHAAQDAAYTVDGVDSTSSANTIYLDNGMVEVDLNGIGSVVLTVAPDEAVIEQAVDAFISEINSFIDLNKTYGDYIDEDVLSTVYGFISDHKNALNAFGIAQNEDGYLEMDAYKLAAAAGQHLSDIKTAFAGFDGLAESINNYAARIATDSPLNYIKEAENVSADLTDSIYNSAAEMMQKLLAGSLLSTYA